MIENYLNYFRIIKPNIARRCCGLFIALMLFSGLAKAQYCNTVNNDAAPQGSLLANVTFGSINNTTGAVWTGPNGYNYYSALTTSVIMGATENLSVTIDPAGSYSGAIVSVWIDWNQDATLSASEWIQVGTNIASNTTATISVPIPITATPGLTRMRIRSRGATNPNGAGDACLTMGSGETEDYDINVVPAAACSGAPTAGTAVTSVGIACPNQIYTVSLQGQTIASGLIYQWEESPMGANTWSPIATGTNPNYTTTMIAPMDYRCTLTCGVASATSTIVTVDQGIATDCYCSPLNGTTLTGQNADNYVTSVEIPTTTLNNPSTSFNSNGYIKFNAPPSSNTATVYPGITYTIKVGSLYTYGLTHAGAWIDFDADGTMDNTTEFIALSSNGGFATGTFTVPLSAPAGTTGLRVRINDAGYTYGGTSQGPCDDDDYGETEDYTLTIAALVNCAGQPSPTTITGPGSICPNVDLNLVANGMTVGLGVTYDWQSDDGSGWMSTGFAGTTMTVAGGITIPTSYRLITNCSLSGLYDTSNVLAVNVNQFYQCYCSPFTGSPLSSQYQDNFVTGVEILNTTLNNPNSTFGSNGYFIFNAPPASNTATLNPGITYTINVSSLYTYGLSHAGAWIDWDGDGTFDNSSEYINVMSNGTYATATFTVPLTATSGMTGLRVRVNDWGNNYGGTNQGPCDDDNYGETEDYVVTIPALANCAGQPAHATIAGPTGICANVDVNFTASGMTVGLGITYDWQSDDGSGWMTTGSAGTTLNVAGGITVPTSYRLVTHCALSNLFDTSNVVAVGINSFYDCYCSPFDGTVLCSQYPDNFVTGVEIVSTTLNNQSTGFNGNGYSKFNAPPSSNTAVLQPGISYTINVSTLYTYGLSHAGAWMDFDGDGTFDNTTEYINLQSNGTYATASFTVPVSAISGMTGLRVRVNDWGYTYGGTSQGPCDDDDAGETEDYVVTIPALTNCAGQPTHATIAGPSAACANIDFGFVATGMTVGLGVTYDWQADDGSGWMTTGAAGTTINVAGGITIPTSYRLVTHCALSNLYDTSNVIAVSIKTFYDCYCSPLTGTPLSSQYAYNFIEKVNVQGTTLNYPTSSYNNNAYMQISPSSSPTATADLLQGVTYIINVDLAYPQYDESAAWIDFDGDGLFDNTTEYIPLTSNGTTGSTGTFVTPVTAILGQTGMRIRANDWGYMYGPANTGSCDDDEGGETEDYVITILTAPSCLPPSGLSETNVTTTTADVAWTSAAPLHQVEYAPGSSFVVGTGTRVTTGANPYTIIGLSSSTQHSYYVRAICAPGDTSMWTMGNAFYTLCAPITVFPWNDDVESQPVNQGTGPLIGCWNATPTPSTSTYTWWVNNGPTGSSSTGPTSANSGTRYFYTEASFGSTNAVATLTSPTYDITSLATPSLDFYYHMNGATIGKLVVEIHDGTTWNRVDSLVGQQQPSEGSPWLLKSVPLTGYTGVIQVRFEGTRGSSFTGDIAIDDIMINASPLAVKLDKISAVNNGTSNRVDWNTLSEAGTDKFELQGSADGKNFHKLTSVIANGEASRYTYIDKAPYQGNNYYRLLMIEANGKVTYSETVKAFVKSAGFSVEVYPNPVSDNLTVNVAGVQGSDATVQVTDVTGKVIKTVKMNSKTTINMSGLASGVYLIKYQDADHTQTIRVSKH